ncbi:MAG: hypothetical protein R3190_11725, partial [Thermoanaerobaculia bacterium]|nr:hypothetical protein [Thermoanaerobaculia bacterium]
MGLATRIKTRWRRVRDALTPGPVAWRGAAVGIAVVAAVALVLRLAHLVHPASALGVVGGLGLLLLLTTVLAGGIG